MYEMHLHFAPIMLQDWWDRSSSETTAGDMPCHHIIYVYSSGQVFNYSSPYASTAFAAMSLFFAMLRTRTLSYSWGGKGQSKSAD